MASLYNADLKPIGPGVKTHPYDHATKLFLADTYRLTPKQSFLYYVCININTDLISSFIGLGSPDGVSTQALLDQYETGLMAKRVDLPKFTLNTKTLNAYNRKNIIQNSISYEPVTINFHDDAADVVTTFWNDYYTYYYRDSDYADTVYGQAHKYQPQRPTNMAGLPGGWGFTPRMQNLQPFLKSIQIFSLHNKRFTEYVLINPIITAWRHGEHNSSESTGTLENTMTLAYETVKYKTGYITVTEMPGFGTIHYDTKESPIATSATNIFSSAGLIGALSSGTRDLARPDGQPGGSNLTGAALNAYRLYQNLKNINIKNVANQTIGQIGISVINGAVNGAINNMFVPTASGTPGYGGVYASSQTYGGGSSVASPPYVNPSPNNFASIAGTAAGSAVGTVTGYVTRETSALFNNGNNPNPASAQTYQIFNTDGSVKVDVRTGQPVAGDIIGVRLDNTGKPISQFTSVGTKDGSPDEADLEINVVSKQETVDADAGAIWRYAYQDGTVKWFQPADNDPGYNIIGQPPVYYNNSDVGRLKLIQTVPGAGYATIDTYNTNPANTRDVVAAGGGYNPAAQQFYTDPRTGIVYSVGNSTTAQITNSFSVAAGGGAGLYVGSTLNTALNSTFLGKSIIGQTVSGTISGVAGAWVGREVNNLLQPIVNKATGAITQVWDDESKNIRNVVGSWTGTGGYDPQNRSKNFVSAIPRTNEYGDIETVETYKNGEIIYRNEDGVIIGRTPAPPTTTFSNFFRGTSGTNKDSTANNPGGSFIKYIFPDQDPAPVEDRSVSDAQSTVTTGQADNLDSGPTDQTTVASNDSGGEDELPA